MSNENTPEAVPATESIAETLSTAAKSTPVAESDIASESFGEMLAEFEQSHSHKSEAGGQQLQGTVVSIDAELVYLDIGYKSEGILPRSAFENNADDIAVGQSFPVSVKGRNIERYYELSRHKVIQPVDWSALE